MDIIEGRYYANDHVGEDGVKEKNVIFILSEKCTTSEYHISTETLYVVDGKVQDLYLNNWISSFLQREATMEEINLFKEERKKLEQLKTFGEIISE